MSIDGFFLKKDGTLYLIEDDDFDVETAIELSSEELIGNYGRVYILNHVPHTSKYKDGQKIRVWFDKILESHPAKIKVLKAEKM
ncbi:DUF3221 domain-containing protein [Bacillus sp. J33]|uniref:DUF3221 domain-containing protein n=1 Tax=Bacillus sp. J33 TaxID=935836 RepID=UPI0004B4E7C9|nr:DUF3221 domain-containing protein [Bacillus sp. J33]